MKNIVSPAKQAQPQTFGQAFGQQCSPRERILHTASRLFYQAGIRATGIDQIIAESAVSKVTFYRQFPSKNALILAFLAERHQRWITWFSQALQRHGGTLSALLPTLAEWFNGNALLGSGLENSGVPSQENSEEGAEKVSEEGMQANLFRGCAFINSLAEIGSTVEGVTAITRQHKQDMTQAIAHLLPESEHRLQDAEGIAMLVDGAIIRAQYDVAPDAALKALAGCLARYQPATEK